MPLNGLSATSVSTKFNSAARLQGSNVYSVGVFKNKCLLGKRFSSQLAVGQSLHYIKIHEFQRSSMQMSSLYRFYNTFFSPAKTSLLRLFWILELNVYSGGDSGEVEVIYLFSKT